MAIALVAASIISLLQIDSAAAARDSANARLQNTLTAYHSYLNGEDLYMPSLMRYAHQNNLTSVRATYQWRDQQQRVDIPEGLAAHHLTLNTSSFIHLSNRITAYGNAAYQYERIRDVILLNSSDYAITFPYTSATEAGGEDRKSTYSFSGGCDVALPFGTLGLEVRYRAMQLHRTKDPRPLNIVSDFHSLLGYSLPLGSRYALAGLVSCDVYKQSSDISIYNPQDEPLYLLMNGIGNSFQRQNISDSPILYRLSGYGGTLALRPIGAEGVWSFANFTWRKLSRFAVLANVAPINFYIEPSWQAYLGYTAAVGSWLIGGHAAYTHSLRQGNDYVLGTSGIREYQVLGTVSNYSHERVAVQAQIAAAQTQRGGVLYNIEGAALRQLQNNPQLELMRASLGHTISGYGIIPIHRHALRFDASAQCIAPLNKFYRRKAAASYRFSPLESYARHLYTIHQTIEISGSLTAKSIFAISTRFLLEVGVHGEVIRYSDSNLRYAVVGNIGLHFQ